MKILIVGSSGFIGSHLKKYLVDLQYEVAEISHKDFDSGDFSGLADADIVVHCAWIREKDLHSLEHLKFAIQTCIFFEECKECGVKVINLGSSSEYGVKYEPMKEDMICEPINTYGIAKLMVTLYAKKLGFNTLRLFTVTGKGGHSFKDIYKEIDKWSDKFQVRDYVDIKIVCLAIQRLIHANHLYGEVINVCSGKQTANMELEGGNKNWDSYAQRQFEQSCWVGSIDKLSSILNIKV